MSSKRTKFKLGDIVEVCNKEEEFLGSYYEAKVEGYLGCNTYIVEYKNLLKEDESGPLREVICANEMRPFPPQVAAPAEDFKVGDKVDVFDNDGWWKGEIKEKRGLEFLVFFWTSGDEMLVSSSKLRVHLKWDGGKWWRSK